MQSLTSELKQVIGRRLETASSSEILEIVSQLCANEEPVDFEFSINLPQLRPRFITLDEMVEDTTTGLIWTQNDIGERHHWAGAKTAAGALTIGGFTDWRLPTIKEILTLVDYDRSWPSIDTVFSTCKPDWYWSSDPLASSPGDFAWLVDFNGGNSGYDSQFYGGLVRAVRSRQ
jgi:hypothetical protein